MEACLSALETLAAGFSLPPCETEGIEALWEAACHWADTIRELAPAPDQDQLLGAAADVASLLARAVSKSVCAAEPHGIAEAVGTEADTPTSGPQLQHAMAGTAAAAAKAAQGLLTLVNKQPPSVSSAVVHHTADGAAAVLLSICSLAVVWDEPRQLEAVACLANMLLQLASDKTCPASVQAAVAQAGVTAGLDPGLLRSSVESLEAGPTGQDSNRRQAVRHHAASLAFTLNREAPLNEEFAKLLADRQLVQQLLRLVVVPVFAEVLQMGGGPAPAPPWRVSGFEILEFVMGDAIRPHARSVLAEMAAPVSLAQTSAAGVMEGVAAAGAAAPVIPPVGTPEAACGTTVGSNLVLLGAKALADLGTAYKQASKAERTQRESTHGISQQEPQQHEHGVPRPSCIKTEAAATARKALLLIGAMQLLPCVFDGARPPASQHQPHCQATACASSGNSSNGEVPALAPAAMRESQRGAKQHAARAAEPAFLQGVVSVAAALHDLVDTGAVPQLVCGMECLPEGCQGDLELDAANAVQFLAMAAIAFDGWRDVSAQPGPDSWVPQDVALTCAAAEALIRLAGKLQRGAPPPGLRPEEDPQRTPHMIFGAVNAWLLALKERVSASGSTRQGQGGPPAMNAEASAPLTAAQARSALPPAVNMAFSAVKLYHIACKMSGAQKRFIFGADDTLMMVLCSMLMMTASRVARLVGEAYGGHLMPLGASRSLEAMKVSVLEAAGVFATDATMLLSGAGSAACGHPSVVMEAVIELVNTAMGAFTTDSSTFILLAPRVVEAVLRMLLVKGAIGEDVLGGYRFWSHVSDWFEECPRLCAEVVKNGVLSDSAVWLAEQLEWQRGAVQRRLSPAATRKLVGSFHALFPHAVRGLAQLTEECVPPGELACRMQQLGHGMEELMGELHRASEAALGAGQAALATPSFWRGLAAPGGLATVLKGVASAIARSLAADPTEGHEDHLDLARICAHRPCSNRACTDLTGASESNLGPGRRCSGCKRVYYCGVGCQRAAWPEHKLVCKRLRDSVEVITLYI